MGILETLATVVRRIVGSTVHAPLPERANGDPREEYRRTYAEVVRYLESKLTSAMVPPSLGPSGPLRIQTEMVVSQGVPPLAAKLTLMLVLFSMLKNDPKFFQSESVKALRLEAFETLMGTEVRERVRIGRPPETARQEALRLAARELPECQDLVLECADRLVASSAYPLDPMSRVIDQHFPMAAGDDAESREKFLRPLASRVIQRISP